MPDSLRHTAAAAMLAASGLVWADGPLTGVWQTDEGHYLLMVRDLAGTAVGVEVGADLSIRQAYVGTARLRPSLPRWSVRSLDGTRTLEFDIQDNSLSGTRVGGGPATLTATRLLSYLGSSIDGVWKSDTSDYYQIVFSGDAENGGMAVVVDVAPGSGGLALKQVSVGKIAGGMFLENGTASYRMYLDGDKLKTAYRADEQAFRDLIDQRSSAAAATSRSRRTLAGRAGTSTCSSATCNLSGETAAYQSSSRVVAGADPDKVMPRPPGGGGGGGGATEKGCAGDFGNLQLQVQTGIQSVLAKKGVNPGFIVSKTKIRDDPSYDGGTVPVYKIVYATDTRATLSSMLTANTRDQNIAVTCDFTKSLNTYNVNGSAAVATAFCDTIKTEMAPLKPQHAALGIRGFKPVDMQFFAPASGSGGRRINSRVFLDSDNSFGAVPSTETEAYGQAVLNCKTWFPKQPTYSPYPAWYVGNNYTALSGTPEISICIDPDYAGGSNPGMFALDYSSTMSPTGYMTKHTQFTSDIDVNLAVMAPYNYTTTTDDGKNVFVHINVPYHTPVTPSSVSSAVVTSTHCYYDKEVEAYIGTEGWFIIGDPNTEPHYVGCQKIPSAFNDQFKQVIYDSFFTKESVTLTNPDGTTATATPAWAFAGGVAQLSAVSLAALGIGGFAPDTNFTGSSTVHIGVLSSAKFLSVQQYAKTSTTTSCSTYIDPNTGEEEEVCNTHSPEGDFVSYTVEAPYCGK